MGAIVLLRRQDSNGSDLVDDSGDNWWWYSPTAYAIKWAILAGIILLCLAFLVGGHIHARRRMEKGLPPLPYHKWLVPRKQRERFVQQHPQYRNQFSFYRSGYGRPYGDPGHIYPMAASGPPPPAYGEPDYVPAYTPPEGATKVDPNQNYAPPAGPPPAHLANSGSAGEAHLAADSGPSQPPNAARTLK